MSRLNRLAFAACTGLGLLTACDKFQDGYSLADLSTDEALESSDIGKRWLATILDTMQGETGQYLKTAVAEYNVRIDYAENLNHMIGVFKPYENSVTLELPLGLTEENFDELVLTGRQVMYHELDHAIRHQEVDHPSGLSVEDNIDGIHTSNEAIANLTAFIGMSEDAQIGSVPSLFTQLGMPDNGRAVYYSVTPAKAASVIVVGLEEGEHFHERNDLHQPVLEAYFDTSGSEWHTLFYSSFAVSDDVLNRQTATTPLSDVLNEVGSGRKVTLAELQPIINPFVGNINFEDGLKASFEAGVFTDEAEQLDAYDLFQMKQKLSRPDGGPANHLARHGSGEGDSFGDAAKQEIIRAFENQQENIRRLQGFFGRCSGASYIPQSVRNNLAEIPEGLNGFISSSEQLINTLRQSDDFTARDRELAQRSYDKIHEVIYPLSEIRVDIHEKFVEHQQRKCTFIDSWGSP